MGRFDLLNLEDGLEQRMFGNKSKTYGEFDVKIPLSNIEHRQLQINKIGQKIVLDHLKEIIYDEIEIDFMDGEIQIDDEYLEPHQTSPMAKLAIIGFFVMPIGILHPMFFLCGFFFVFLGWIPLGLEVVGMFAGVHKYPDEINEKIDQGGGVYRRGMISGIIRGLDTYFSLGIEHEKVLIYDSYEIPPTLKLEVISRVGFVSTGESGHGYHYGEYSSAFVNPKTGKRTVLSSPSLRTAFQNKEQAINEACSDAVEFYNLIRDDWQGPIVLRSIPQISDLTKSKKEKTLPKISQANIRQLSETFDEIKFLS
jgi:hypothetical protein